MRILAIDPGPAFSTFDVHQGWVKALRQLGHTVGELNFGATLDVFWNVHVKKSNGRYQRAFDDESAHHLARQFIKVYLWDFAPDVVLVTAGHFIPTDWYDNVRARGQIPVVLLCTESPYEDQWQLGLAPHVDLVLLNDPTNIDQFARVQPRVEYMPHAYDPDVHHPRDPDPACASDFCFVGTLYPSRHEFFEAVDWTGIDVALAGNMAPLQNEPSRLLKYVAHPVDECCPNDQTARLYASTKASVNLYRKEAQGPDLIEGWSMGPRELELAAIGCFFLREPRGEGDQLLSVLPTFDGPADFEKQLRYFLDHDDERLDMATQARAAVKDRTFENHARQLLELIDRL